MVFCYVIKTKRLLKVRPHYLLITEKKLKEEKELSVERVTYKIGDEELILETGKIGKQANGCAFMHYGDQKAFVSPQIVNKYHVTDGENVKCLIVYDYDKKKEKWNWVVISINR